MSVDALKKYAPLYASLGALDVKSGSAFLLSGEDGDGLNVAARIVAARVTGLSDSAAFDEHADIVVYPRPAEKKSKTKGEKADDAPSLVTVDDVREITDSLYLTPFELDRRVYIIEAAETMSEICQNKLLKSLEEPPPRVCFVLCASGRLLPTVESRCNRIEIPPFDIAVVERELEKYHSDYEAVRLAARASRGNFGTAERILADKSFADLYFAAKRILQEATGSKNFAHAAAIYEKFTRTQVDRLLGIMEYLLCDVARYLLGSGTVFDEKDIASVAGGYTPYSAALAADAVRKAKKYNGAKCMPQAVLDNMILEIMEVRAKYANNK